MRLRTCSVLGCKGGGELGNILVGNKDNRVGFTAVSKTVLFHLTLKAGALVTNPALMHFMDNVKMIGYEGGNGHQLVPYYTADAEEYKRRAKNNLLTEKCVICMALYPDFKLNYQVMDITGSFNSALCEREDGAPPHYNTADIYQQYWGFDSASTVMPQRDVNGQYFNATNTIHVQDTWKERVWNGNALEEKVVIGNERSGHPYPGILTVHKGMQSQLSNPNYMQVTPYTYQTTPRAG